MATSGRSSAPGSPYVLTQLSEHVYRIVEDDPFFENPFIYVLVGSEFLLVVDTGCGSGDLLGFLRDAKLSSLDRYVVVNTHNHFDHVGGNYQFTEVWASDASRAYTQDRFATLGGFVGCPVRPYRVTRWLSDGERIEIVPGKSQIEVMHTPGHTPDSLCLIYTERDPNGVEKLSVFAGDVIYRFAPVLAIGVGVSTTQFELSVRKLIDRLAELSGNTFVGIRCGHVDEALEFEWLERLYRLLRATNGRGSERVRASGWLMRSYELASGDEADRSLSLTVRKLRWLDWLLKPVLRVCFSPRLEALADSPAVVN